MKVLTCDMVKGCVAPVTHIDNKGFLYCTKHGLDRRYSYVPCRKLRQHEVNRLLRGEQVQRY